MFLNTTEKFIRSNLDEIFMCDILEHRCSVSKSGVTVCHLDKSSCWAAGGHLNGLTCADTIDTASVSSVVKKNSHFVDLSERHNFASCLLRLGESKIILYRHFDEGGHGMTQWDRTVPDNIWFDLLPFAKRIPGAYYEVPFLFPTRIKA